MIELNSIVVQAQGDWIANDIDGDTVLVSIEQGKYYGMEVVGSRIWELIAQPRTVLDVCEALLEEFNVSRETCQQDALVFLDQLAEENLVKVVDEPVA